MRDIERNFLDNIMELNEEFGKTIEQIYDAFAAVGMYLEGDCGLYMRAYLASCGKKAFDSMIKNPKAFVQKSVMASYEWFLAVWSGSNYEDYMAKIAPLLKALVVTV